MEEVKKSGEIEPSLLQTEKRIADLEMVVSELKEKLKDVDLKAVSELKEKVEELEDLVMVENAGVIELKKMLEDLGSKIGEMIKPWIPEIPVDLNKKIKDIEEKLSSLPGIVENTKSLVESVKNELTSKIIDLEKKTEEINKFTPRVAEIEKEIAFIEEKLKTPIPELFVKDIENMKSSLLVNSAKVDAVEKFVSGFAKEIEEIKPTIRKFETVQKIDEENKRIEERLKELKLIEKKMEELKKFIEDRSEIIEGVNKKFKLIESIDRKVSEFGSRMNAMRMNVIGQVSNIAESLARQIQELDNKTDIIKSEIDKRVKVIGEIERDVLDTRSRFEELSKELAKYGEKIEVVKKLEKDIEEVRNNLFSQVKVVSERIGEIEKIRSALEKRIEEIVKVSIQAEAEKVEKLKSTIEDLSSRVTFIEENYPKGLENIQAFVSPINAQIMEIIDKLVFLETRVIALENMVRETSRVLPVIIE